MEREIDRLRDGALSRWDVALVLFAVLGALSLLIGIVTAAIKYLA